MRVALMVTCINDAMFPAAGQAVVTLLRRLGVDVDFPAAQTCCATRTCPTPSAPTAAC